MSVKKKPNSKPKTKSSPPMRPVVELIANSEDSATGKAFNTYRFKNVDGGEGNCRIERSKVSDVRALGQALLDRNAALPVNPQERMELLARLIQAAPKRLEAYAAKVGWVDGQNAFVRHGGVSGRIDSRRVLRPPLWVETARHRCQVKGSSVAWLSRIAPIIAASSRVQLACAAVYAAPLVRLANMQPFCIALHGSSSVGKSSALIMAGSVLGLGTKESIPNWNLSVAGLHETATRFNDHALLIDETASADLSKEQLYYLFRRVTYTYAEGADRLRHSKSGFATSREAADAKGIMITTSEHSLDALAALVGKTRDAGEIARAFNVPAVVAGHPDIFDLLPEAMNADKRKAWVNSAFSRVRSDCPERHGGAFKRFVVHLVAKERTALIGQIDAAMAVFARALALDSDFGAVRHAARNFGLIYAGGALAIEAKMLPVTKEQLLRSIVTCFRDGLAAIGPPPDVEKNAIAQLRVGISASELPHKSATENDDDSVGFRRRVGDDDPRILLVVKPTVFDRWFVDDAHRCAALRWLHAKGLLKLRDGSVKLPAGRIPAKVVVSFEKRRVKGKRENSRWLRFIDPTPLFISPTRHV